MVSEDELRSKRIYVGLLSVGCLLGAAMIEFYPVSELFQAALIRVGVLLGAFWLAMPTKDRPAAWKRMPSSNWTIAGLIFTAVLIPRLKYMFPVVAVVAGIAWFAKPRRSNSSR